MEEKDSFETKTTVKEHPFCAPEERVFTNLAREEREREREGNRNLPMDTEYLLDPRIPRLKKGHKIRTTEDFEENHKGVTRPRTRRAARADVVQETGDDFPGVAPILTGGARVIPPRIFVSGWIHS